MAINRTHLAAFHAVATAGGFSRASRAMNVSQSTLSAQVSALQERFGVTLFERQGRDIRLTEIGRRLQLITQKQSEAEMEAMALLSGRQSDPRGPFCLGSVQPHLALRMLKSFREIFPKCDCTLEIGNSLDLIESVLNHSLHCAIITMPVTDPRLRQIRLHEEHLVAIVGAEHPWFKRKRIRIEDLAGHAIIFREKGSQTRLAIEEMLEARGIGLDSVIQIDEWAAVRFAAALNLGVAILYESESHLAGDCTVLEIADSPRTLTHYLITLENRADELLVQPFMDIAEKM